VEASVTKDATAALGTPLPATASHSSVLRKQKQQNRQQHKRQLEQQGTPNVRISRKPYNKWDVNNNRKASNSSYASNSRYANKRRKAGNSKDNRNVGITNNRRDFNNSLGAAARAETLATAGLDVNRRKNNGTATAWPKATQVRAETSGDANKSRVAKTSGNGVLTTVRMQETAR
jgi:hypothetical protein